MFGTLGAAVIYILSTAVIQGIVPGADLAASTGPFGLAFARMFNPTVGSIVMALAAMACVGSLLGWQFTLAQTAKDAADSKMFPGIFSKANALGAPIAGMIVMGILQSLMALSTISPNLSEQFAALVNLAVVTNVLPYIISLSALFAMMRNAGTPPAKYRRNAIVAVIALAYSVYAIYASGKDAVLGGMLVMAVGYVIYGFMASRFTSVTTAGRAAAASAAAALAIAMVVLAGLSAPPAHADEPALAGTLARIKQSGQINLGYLPDAQPFAYRDKTGQITGYTVGLCKRISDQIKNELKLARLTVKWVDVTPDDRLHAIQEHRIDLLCGDADTLASRQGMSFSIPVYPGGIGALLRSDASPGLKEVLSGEGPSHPTWRAAPAQLLSRQTISVVEGSPTQRWLGGKLGQFQITASVVPVPDVQSGVRKVLDRQTNVLFGERSLLLAIASSSPASGDLTVLDRQFTFLPVAIGMARDDDNLRLLVDRTLSRLFASSDFSAIYTRWFGEPDADTRNFFRLSALPE
jgi:putrescine:ornithine antiporter